MGGPGGATEVSVPRGCAGCPRRAVPQGSGGVRTAWIRGAHPARPSPAPSRPQPEPPAPGPASPPLAEEEEKDLNKALGVERFEEILSDAHPRSVEEPGRIYGEEDFECEWGTGRGGGGAGRRGRRRGGRGASQQQRGALRGASGRCGAGRHSGTAGATRGAASVRGIDRRTALQRRGRRGGVAREVQRAQRHRGVCVARGTVAARALHTRRTNAARGLQRRTARCSTAAHVHRTRCSSAVLPWYGPPPGAAPPPEGTR